MAPIDSYIHQHPYNAIGTLVLVYNVALYMPPPTEKSSVAYRWFFGVMHALALTIPRLASNFLPQGSWVYKMFAGGNGATNGNTSVPPPPNSTAMPTSKP